MDKSVKDWAWEIQALVGKILRRSRKLKGLTIAQVAVALDIDAFKLKAMEEGRIKQPCCLVVSLTKFYGYGLTDFYRLDYQLVQKRFRRLIKELERAQLSIIGERSKP